MCADSRGNGQVGERPSALFHVGDDHRQRAHDSWPVQALRTLQKATPVGAAFRSVPQNAVGWNDYGRPRRYLRPGRRDPLQIEPRVAGSGTDCSVTRPWRPALFFCISGDWSVLKVV